MVRAKPRIFISHIHEDRGIAYQLKEFLAEAFLGFFDIFVSSDDASIRVGDNWSAMIERALHESELVIVMLSNNALDRRGYTSRPVARTS